MLPPLRERREDILLLVSHFVEVFSRRMGKQISSIPRETLDAFTSYSWPSKVRELQNLIERAVILSAKGVLANSFSTLDADLLGKNPTNPNFVVLRFAQGGTFWDSQRAVILRALDASGWIVRGMRGAAARLGRKRTTLIFKMKELGISRTVPQPEVARLNQNREPGRPWQPAAD